MNVLLTMSLAGSLMMVVYTILKLTLDHRFHPKLRHACLSISMVYFMTPFPLMLEDYRFFLRRLFNLKDRFEQFEHYNSQLQIELSNVIEITEKGKVLFIQNKTLILFLFFTISFVCIFFDRQLRSYIKARKQVLKDSVLINDSELLQLFEFCKAQVGVKRKVQLRKLNQKASPFTMGIFVPCVIVTDYPLTFQDYEMIFLHELYHIKNQDILFKFLMLITMSINWYNPFVYYLRNEMNLVFELVSDESLLKNKDRKFLKRYGSFIIDMATENFQQTPDFSAAMSKPGKDMQHRLKIAFREKNESKILYIVLTFVILIVAFMNSFTVIAYEPMLRALVKDESNFDAQLLDNNTNSYYNFKNDDILLDYKQAYSTLVIGTSTFDVCFQDDNGTQYEIQSITVMNEDTSRELIHTPLNNLREGYYIKHIANEDGGCEVSVYKAYYDSEDLEVIQADLYSQTVYVKCLHK